MAASDSGAPGKSSSLGAGGAGRPSSFPMLDRLDPEAGRMMKSLLNDCCNPWSQPGAAHDEMLLKSVKLLDV